MRDAILFVVNVRASVLILIVEETGNSTRHQKRATLIRSRVGSDSLLRRLDRSQILEWEARLAGKVV